MIRLEEAIDRIEFMIQQARRIPGTGRVLLDEDALFELLDQLREHLPEEVKQAAWTVQEQSRLLTEAQQEAARITARAAEQAESLVSGQQVLRRAEAQARQVLAEAESRGAAVRQSADEYALHQMQQLEAQLVRIMASVKKSLETLKVQLPASILEDAAGEDH